MIETCSALQEGTIMLVFVFLSEVSYLDDEQGRDSAKLHPQSQWIVVSR